MMIAHATPSQLAARARQKERAARFRSAAIEERPVYRLQTAVRLPKSEPDIDPHKMPGSIWLDVSRIRLAAPPAPRSEYPRIDEIQQAVAESYGVTKLDLVSSRRTADIVRPRQVAMYIAKTITPKSFPEIGRRFGGRDHSTALHAVQKIKRLLDVDSELAAEVEAIKACLRRGHHA